MVAKFRALSENDIHNVGSVVRSNQPVDNYDVLSDKAVSEFDFSGVERPLTSMHTRKFIKLTKPTFNHVLGRSDCLLLAKLLNVGEDTWKGIVNCSIVYDFGCVSSTNGSEFT